MYIYTHIYIERETRWVGRMSRESIRLPFWEIREYEDHGFESGTRIFKPWSSQTNDCKVDTCCSLAWRLALLG